MRGRVIRVRVRVANGAAVHAPRRAPAVVGRALTMEGPDGVTPDVVLLSEVATVDLVRLVPLVLGREVPHDIVQWGGGHGAPESGTAVVSLLGPITHRRREVGYPSTAEGGGVRERSWCGAEVVGRWWWAGHALPGRAPVGRAAYIMRGRLLPGLLGADWNRAPGWLRKALTRAYRGSGVLGVAAWRSWRPRLVGTVDVGGDHPAVDVDVRVRLKQENLLFRARRLTP